MNEKKKQSGRGAFHQSKQVLIFNGALTLVAIARSVRSASELSGFTPQSISFACRKRSGTVGSHYYRHTHPDVEIEMEDLDNLNLKSYDTLCNCEGKYYNPRELVRRKCKEQERKRKKMNDEK